jgi:malonate transporter and related proteins
MSSIQAIFAVTFPFFALVLCGYLAARRGLLPVAAIPGLNAFVLYFALPCMLFRFGANTPLAQLLNWPLMLLWATCGALVVALCIAISLNARTGLKDAAFGALVGAFPNSGFMGIPLFVALLGPAAAGTVIVTMLVDMFFTSSLCLALAQLPEERARGASPASAFARSLRGAATNPLPWAIAGGALFAYAGLSFPTPVNKFVSLLADAASPVALFTIGAVLGRSVVQATHASAVSDYLPVALVAGLLAHRLGFGLDSRTLLIAVLVAALPSASNVSLLAERFGADNDRVARIIMASTALAFVSFSGLVWALGVRPAAQ